MPSLVYSPLSESTNILLYINQVHRFQLDSPSPRLLSNLNSYNDVSKQLQARTYINQYQVSLSSPQPVSLSARTNLPLAMLFKTYITVMLLALTTSTIAAPVAIADAEAEAVALDVKTTYLPSLAPSATLSTLQQYA